MIRIGIVLGLAAIASCDKPKDRPAPRATPGSGVAAPELPDPLSVDWLGLRYDLGSLGSVVAVDGRAAFRVVEDDDGTLHATQPGTGDRAATLELDPPTLVDLDGDRHEEAVIPFELKSARADGPPHVFGAFVFALRDGIPLQIATITTTSRPGFTLDGATIVTTEGARWRWDATRGSMVAAP